MALLSVAPSAQHFRVPLNEFKIQHPGKRLVVGVANIASVSSPEDAPNELKTKKLLLLQRAETEELYPLMYELPGGGAEKDDASLLATVIRETEEETGLLTPKSKAIQFNFLVGVEQGDELNVRLNPEEHCSFAWVDNKDDLSHFPITEKMLKVVSDAVEAINELTQLK